MPLPPVSDVPGPTPDATPAAGTPIRLVIGWRTGTWLAAGVFTVLLLRGLAQAVPAPLTQIGIGALLALALDPIVVRLRTRLGVSRSVAVAVVGAALASVFALLVIVLGPPALDQAERFGRELPETVEDLYDVPIAGGWLERHDARGEVEQWVDELPDRVDAASVSSVAQRLIGGVLNTIVVLVVAISVLLDGDRLVGRLRGLFPAEVEDRAVRAGQIFYKTIGAYFSGSVLVAGLAGTFILAVGLALGVPLAPAAALWAVAVNLIPQVGGFLTGSFFTVLGLSKGVGTGIACLVLYVLWMNFENHVLQPAIVGHAVNLSPPVTMLAALVGGAAFGIPGALIATPLCGALKAFYLEVRFDGTAAHENEPRRWSRKRPWSRLRGRHRDGEAPDR
ncbi:MAG: AI-2E family transporter [Acidimicrobiia bacterium]